jgi:regulatory protein
MEKKTISEKTVLSRMAHNCSMKEYCEQDIRLKIRRYNLEDELAEDRIITSLIKGRYIDNKRFVESYLHDKFHFNKWGKAKIEAALRNKRIPQELINDAFSKISKDKWQQTLLPLLENKFKSISFQSEMEAKTKLLRFAAGRGFGYDESLKCIDELLCDKRR